MWLQSKGSQTDWDAVAGVGVGVGVGVASCELAMTSLPSECHVEIAIAATNATIATTNMLKRFIFAETSFLPNVVTFPTFVPLSATRGGWLTDSHPWQSFIADCRARVSDF